MIAPDPFYSPKRTVARGRYHIADLRARADDFMNGRARGTYRIEKRPDGNQHKIHFDRDFFEDLSCIAFDAANNLRSALDQIAYATAVLAAKPKTRNAYFPIASTASDFDGMIKRRRPDLLPEIIAIFKTFCGNRWLSILSILCNTQKHAALIPFKTGDLQVMVHHERDHYRPWPSMASRGLRSGNFRLWRC